MLYNARYLMHINVIMVLSTTTASLNRDVMVVESVARMEPEPEV